MSIDIRGIPKVAVLKALYDAAKVVGGVKFGPLQYGEAESLVGHRVARKEKLVTCLVPKGFQLRLDDHTMIDVPASKGEATPESVE
jgi:hypothetical protein